MVTDVAPERSLGWLKEPVDTRDYKLFQVHPELILQTIPSIADTRGPYMPSVGNQGSLGSCVAWGCLSGFGYAAKKMGVPYFDGSELFEYANARILGGFPLNQDTGSYIRDGMKALAQFGNAEESTWPYIISNFSQRPPQQAYDNASQHQALRYISVPNNDDAIDSVIASGFPVVFGIPIYQNFPMGNGVGDIPNPQGQIIGGHCMKWVAYDRVRRKRTVKNSWGESWGNGGYAEMSYDYCHMAEDLWYIEIVEGELPPPPPPPPPAKVVDGIGLWTPEHGIVHLWPPRLFEEMDETVGGIGVHFTDGSTQSVWP